MTHANNHANSQTYSDVFINFPNDTSNKRELHPLTNINAQGNTWKVSFAESHLTVEPNQELLLFYTLNNVFMQQSVCVTAVHDHDTNTDTDVDEHEHGCCFEINLKGKPVSAESRHCFRVCTVLADWWIKLDNENHCQIADISQTGCAIICKHPYKINETVNAKIIFRDKEYTGQLQIQSIKNLHNGEYRCGLLCINDNSSGGKLHQGLQKMSMEMQRTQLRRLSGAA